MTTAKTSGCSCVCWPFCPQGSHRRTWNHMHSCVMFRVNQHWTTEHESRCKSIRIHIQQPWGYPRDKKGNTNCFQPFLLHTKDTGVSQQTRVRWGYEGNTCSNTMIRFSPHHSSNGCCGLAQLRGQGELTVEDHILQGQLQGWGAFWYPENAPEGLRSAAWPHF